MISATANINICSTIFSGAVELNASFSDSTKTETVQREVLAYALEVVKMANALEKTIDDPKIGLTFKGKQLHFSNHQVVNVNAIYNGVLLMWYQTMEAKGHSFEDSCELDDTYDRLVKW